MKTYSNIMPNAYTIINLENGQAEVLFAENITQAEVDGNTMYEYDLYVITTPYRDNLAEAIEDDLSIWLQYAKDHQPIEEYTEIQLLQQDMTDLQLESIKQGQAITDLELEVLANV